MATANPWLTTRLDPLTSKAFDEAARKLGLNRYQAARQAAIEFIRNQQSISPN